MPKTYSRTLPTILGLALLTKRYSCVTHMSLLYFVPEYILRLVSLLSFYRAIDQLCCISHVAHAYPWQNPFRVHLAPRFSFETCLPLKNLTLLVTPPRRCGATAKLAVHSKRNTLTSFLLSPSQEPKSGEYETRRWEDFESWSARKGEKSLGGSSG